MIEFSDNDLQIIGRAIDGWYSHTEGDTLIFGSHTFPSYRIMVEAKQAKEKLEERFQEIRNQACSE